jgi:excisionase family DNA binding protein
VGARRLLATKTATGTDMTEQADLLYGVPKIAEFLGLTPKAVYHLVASKRLPSFKIGATVCARRASLLALLAQLEQQSIAS